jgi:hypothetical protein
MGAAAEIAAGWEHVLEGRDPTARLPAAQREIAGSARA